VTAPTPVDLRTRCPGKISVLADWAYCWQIWGETPPKGGLCRQPISLARQSLFSKGFTAEDDGISETTFDAKLGCQFGPHYGCIMPVNRTFKRSSPRHNGGRCSPTAIVQRHLDDDLGIRIVHIERGARLDVVARGRLLAARADYPPPHVVNAIADLIAHHVHF